MFKSLAEDVMKTASVRHALLLALVANRPLLVLTGEQGDVPACPGPGWVKILDNNLRWAAVESSSDLAKEMRNRTLPRVYDGKHINVLTSIDPLCHLTKTFINPPCKTLDQPPMPEITGNIYGAIMWDAPSFDEPPQNQGFNVMMALPGANLPESVLNRLVLSVDLRHMSPSEVKDMLDFVMSADIFSPESIAALRAKHAQVVEGVSAAFCTRLDKAIRATRPDTVEFMERVSIGILPTFGFGASPRVAINVMHVSAAHAVLAGRDYVRSSDMVDVFPKVVEHAVTWGAAKPGYGTSTALTQIAEWAVSI